MPLHPGTTLGPYSVTAKIGEGGMDEEPFDVVAAKLGSFRSTLSWRLPLRKQPC